MCTIYTMQYTGASPSLLPVLFIKCRQYLLLKKIKNKIIMVKVNQSEKLNLQLILTRRLGVADKFLIWSGATLQLYVR